jgi:hypothetical protein
MPGRIKTYCHLKANRVFVQGVERFAVTSGNDLKSFTGKVYREFGIKYPKFHKMDEISKLGFLTAELLLQQLNASYHGNDVGIVLANSNSTIVTDSKFQESIQDGNFFPSPAVFVYTLPNIMIGEISIRHNLRGENAFFIFDAFNIEVVNDYIEHLFGKQKIKHCIGGWVDQSHDSYEAFMYWVEPSHGNNVENLSEKVIDLYRRN